MDVKPKVSDIENHQIKIEAEIAYSEFEKEFEKQLSEYKKLAQIPGFRKGKIPRNIMISKFSDSIKNETLKKVINQAVDKISSDKEIDIYGGLTITNEKIDYPVGEPLKLTLTAYKKPDCEIGQHEGLSFEEEKKLIKEEHYTLLKDKILEQQGELKEVEGGSIKIKDLITVNVSFLDKLDDDDNKSLNLKDHIFYYSGEGSGEGKGATPDYLNYLYQQISKAKKGDSQEVQVSFPDSVKQEALKAKKVKLKFEIVNVKRIEKPELDDALLKKMNYESKEDFDKKIRKNLDHLVDGKIKENKEASLLRAIKAKTEFKIPEIFYENSTQISWDRQKAQYPQGSLPNNPPEEWAKRFREDIKGRVENELIINKIKEQYEVNVGEEEMKKEIEKLSHDAKKDVKEFRREIIKSGDYTKIKENLVINKIFDLLYAKNKLVQGKEFAVEALLEN